MTVVPLPDVPCLRVALGVGSGAAPTQGSRFYLSYAGSAPTGGNCNTLAADIAAAWATDIAPLVNEDWALVEVDVIDIATSTGFSGRWTGSNGGARSGVPLPTQAATNVEYNIALRYRGGKPRMYLPAGVNADLADLAHYNSTFVNAANAGVLAFFTAVEALSVGAVGALQHVLLSYYHGFTNIVNSSGRMRAVPTYRPTALHRNVTGYSAKGELSSQKRRRTSTTE